jgi:hypothetical protein
MPDKHLRPCIRKGPADGYVSVLAVADGGSYATQPRRIRLSMIVKHHSTGWLMVPVQRAQTSRQLHGGLPRSLVPLLDLCCDQILFRGGRLTFEEDL